MNTGNLHKPTPKFSVVMLFLMLTTLSIQSSDYRHKVVPLIGLSMAIAGIYNLCKNTKYEEQDMILSRLSGLILLFSGFVVTIISRDIIYTYDNHMKQIRLQTGLARWSDIF